MADDTSATRVGVDVARCLSEASLTPSSRERVEPTLQAFVAYLGALSVVCLDDVQVDVARRFIESRLRSGQPPSLATQHNRRTALRTLFRCARELGLASLDPTLDIALEPTGSVRVRPLTDVEVERCRDVAQWRSSQVAAAWALGEATARGAEIARVTVEDLNLAQRWVDLRGGARTVPRRAELTDWGATTLERRLHSDRFGLAIAFSGARSPAGQASTCRAISSVLVRAGLAGQSGVRPASVAGWAGRRVFDETGSLQAAARAMGVRSLDRAARLIGLDWSSDG